MKIMIVVGARPNFMKAAPILRAISTHNRCVAAGSEIIQHILVHTGQHYDSAMSDMFFADLELPCPDVFLNVGSGSHAAQTAEIMRRFEEVLLGESPELVMVVGDVNSTVACALVTAKMNGDAGRPKPLLAHVEAGLRSFDRHMPEEHNRVVTDHLSNILFVTEESGVHNLQREGIRGDHVVFVGNTMIDSLLAFQSKADGSVILNRLRLRDHCNGDDATKPYALLTLHRPSNVDDPDAFIEIVDGIRELAASYPVIFPAHPRTLKQIQQHGFTSSFQNLATGTAQEQAFNQSNGIWIIEPQGYIDFLCLMKHARIVITDSGGIQEETTCLGVPCVTVRENTERPVTITHGTNLLGGTDHIRIREAILRQLAQTYDRVRPEKWDGKASERIVRVINQRLRAFREEQVAVAT